MRITPHLFDAFLKCETKCWLRASGEDAAGSSFSEWFQNQVEFYRVAQVERLLSDTLSNELLVSPAVKELKGGIWRFATGVVAQEKRRNSPTRTEDEGANEAAEKPRPEYNVESHIHAVERVPPEVQGKAA